MAENQSENPFFFFNPPLHQTRTKTNPPLIPRHHHSFPMTSNSAGYNNSHRLHNQQQQERGLSLSLSFTQQQPVPLGPFTGYASVLSSSRFLRPAQLILDELFGVHFDVPAAGYFHGNHGGIQSSAADEAVMSPAEFAGLGDRTMMEFRWKDSRLMLMLDEVYRRYKLYCQQMQTAVASFEAVAGLGNAAPFIYYAIRVVSSHFISLKNALLHRIRCLSTPSSGCRNPYSPDLQQPEALQYQTHSGTKTSTTFNLNFFLQSSPPPPPPPPPPPVWRSQRGLPDHAVAVLKSWLFEHFLHPYPTDSEKQILAQQTGLSRTQVSNWFINARVRIWKPMVEEIQLLDSEQKAATSSSSSPFVQAASAANVGSKRTRSFERRQRQLAEDQNQTRNSAGSVDCSLNDGVSLALALPRATTNVPANNPSSWPSNVSTAAYPTVGRHGFTGAGGSNQWY